MAGPMPGEDIGAYRARRQAELAHERGSGPAPAPSGFEAAKAKVAAQHARKSGPSNPPGKAPVNLDRAVQDANEIERLREGQRHGGIQSLNKDEYDAADKELAQDIKEKGLKAVAEEREAGARLAGRNRFDLDAPAATPVPSAPGRSPKRPSAPIGTSPAGPVQVRQMGSPPGGTAPSGSTPKATAPSPGVARPVATAKPAVNKGTIAPTPANRPADAEPSRPAGTPAMPSVSPGQQESGGPSSPRIRYGRFEPGGQGTLFGTSGMRKGNKISPRAELSDAGFQGGPIKGESAMITPTGRISPNAKAPDGGQPVPKSKPVSGRNVQSLPSSPGVTGHANAETSKAAESMPDNPIEISRPKAGPTPPGPEGPGAIRPPARTGRTGSAPRSPETGGGRAGISVEGDRNVVGNTYNVYHNYGTHYGDFNVGGGGGGRPSPGPRVPRSGGTGGSGGGTGRPSGRPGSGSPRAPHEEHKSDIWVDLPATGRHSAREGFEHITGQRDSGGRRMPPPIQRSGSKRQPSMPSSGGVQTPISSSTRASGGTTGTGTNFNWTGPSPMPAGTSSGGSPWTGRGNGYGAGSDRLPSAGGHDAHGQFPGQAQSKPRTSSSGLDWNED